MTKAKEIMTTEVVSIVEDFFKTRDYAWCYDSPSPKFGRRGWGMRASAIFLLFCPALSFYPPDTD
jgi:hypothetical protein